MTLPDTVAHSRDHWHRHQPGGPDALDWSGTINMAGTHANRPAAGATNKGATYYETDTTNLFRSDGATWTQIASAGGGAGVGSGVDWYNVKTGYGATGLGIADDTTAIQNAINAAIAAGGGIVFFPAGTYKVTSTLLVNANNIGLVGDGYSSNIVISANLTSGIKFTEATRGFMRDLRVSAAGSTTITNLILITGTASTEDVSLWNVSAIAAANTDTCFAVATDSVMDISEIMFYGCLANGGGHAGQFGWRLGNGAVGNVLSVRCYGCDARDFANSGVIMNACTLQWYGGTSSNNSAADFYVWAAYTLQPIVIQGVRSELSNRFLHQDNPGTYSPDIHIIDCVVHQFSAANKRAIEVKGGVTIDGLSVNNTTNDPVLYNELGPGFVAKGVLTNNPSSTGPWSGVAPRFAVGIYSMDALGYPGVPCDDILPIPQTNCTPSVDVRVQAGYSSVVQGNPYIVSSGVVLDIKSGGVMVLDQGLGSGRDLVVYDVLEIKP